mgnify:CR=1 FL=1
MRRLRRVSKVLILCLLLAWARPAYLAAETAGEEGKEAGQKRYTLSAALWEEGFAPENIAGVTAKGLYFQSGESLCFYRFGTQKISRCCPLPEGAERRFWAAEEAFFALILDEAGILTIHRYEGTDEMQRELGRGIRELPEGFLTVHDEWIFCLRHYEPALYEGAERVTEEVLRLNLRDLSLLPLRALRSLQKDGLLLGRSIACLGGDSDNIYLHYAAGKQTEGQYRQSGLTEKAEYRVSYEAAENILTAEASAVSGFIAGSHDYFLITEKQKDDAGEALLLYRLSEAAFEEAARITVLEPGETLDWALADDEDIYLGTAQRLLAVRIGEAPELFREEALPRAPFLTTRGALLLETEGRELLVTELLSRKGAAA